MTTRRQLFPALAAIAATLSGIGSAFAATPEKIFDLNDDLSGQISDWLCDVQLDTGREPTFINLTRKAYKYAVKHNLIDFYPGTLPRMFGFHVDVPGTEFSRVLAQTKPITANLWSALKTGEPPLGTPVFEWSEENFVERVIDWFVDSECNGVEPTAVYFTRNAYQQAQRANLIDFIPDEQAHIPVFLGRGVVIVLDRRPTA